MTDPDSTDAPAPLWRPIPLTEFVLPETAAVEGLTRVWRRLWSKDSGEDAELVDSTQVPPDRIAHLVPQLDREACATSLGEALDSWCDKAPDAPRSVALVGPPGSGAQAVLEIYARQKGLAVVAAPTRAELAAGTARVELPGDATTPLVLPPLERLFLRRCGGLDLLRGLLADVQRERRAFVAACDSWSWSFLRRTLHGRIGFDRVLAPAAFDGAALRTWLRALDPSVVFVDARTGEPMLADEDEVHPFLRSLAARARGAPGIAAGIWRRALGGARLGAPREGVRDCRLPRWPDVALPEYPAYAGKPGVRLLHALLIHEGLEEEWLPSVLPDTDAHVRPLLWDLHGQSLVGEEEGVWRVSVAGYPAARAALAGANVPLDDF